MSLTYTFILKLDILKGVFSIRHYKHMSTVCCIILQYIEHNKFIISVCINPSGIKSILNGIISTKFKQRRIKTLQGLNNWIWCSKLIVYAGMKRKYNELGLFQINKIHNCHKFTYWQKSFYMLIKCIPIAQMARFQRYKWKCEKKWSNRQSWVFK